MTRNLAVPVLAVALLAAGVASRAMQSPKPQHTNHLAGESSPYLLQHAHNPVDWYPWGPEAFEKAKREGKPIFLSVGYSSCHWCHVMERESFEDEGIAELLNAHFVAIKVDREQRPDIDEIYMTAVQLMTGSGGWPMSVFLTPDAKPFGGGTYFKRDTFAELLRKVSDEWAKPDRRRLIDRIADEMSQNVGEAAKAPQAGSLSPGVVESAVETWLANLDPQNGGLGDAPKFPPSIVLEVLLDRQARKPDPKALHFITLTLDHMARGGIYDQVGGGFHRYSTDAKWLAPHFEKMLYDNALLSRVYLKAYRLTKKPYYLRIGRETLDFCLRELHDPKGGFWSTLDADSQGEEGRFYLWTPAEVSAALKDPADAQLFCRTYDVTKSGNFHGRSIPNLLAKAVDPSLWPRLDGIRSRLRTARNLRPHPALDDKVLASWNGLMLRSLATAYDVTGDARYRKEAGRTAEFLLTTMLPQGRIVHAYRGGKTQSQSFLDDYGFVLTALLELHAATSDKRWLDASKSLAERMVADFWDEREGTFFSTPSTGEALITRVANAQDQAIPSGQAMAALSLVRLSRLTGDGTLRDKAQRALNRYATPMKRHPGSMAGMLLAANTYYTPDSTSTAGVVTATLEGAPNAARTGTTTEVVVRLKIKDGWHVYGPKPSTTNIPTTITVPPGPFRLLGVQFPPTKRETVSGSEAPAEVLTGNVTIRCRLTAVAGAQKAKELRLKVRYQACNERVCERPVEVLLTAPLR